MKKIIRNITLFALAILVMTGCAEVQHVEPCLQGETYGFWGGLLHGIIAPISFIVSLFNENVDVWATNNNGSWYTFGFLLGVGGLFSSR